MLETKHNKSHRSKLSFVLFLIAIIFLAGAGGYITYAKYAKGTLEYVGQNNTKHNKVSDSSVDQADTTKTGVIKNGTISTSRKEHKLTGCGMTIQTPSDWEVKGDKFITLSSPETVQRMKQFDEHEVLGDLIINCEDSVKDDLRKEWNKYSGVPADLNSLEGIKKVLLLQSDKSDLTTRIFRPLSTIEISTFGSNKGVYGIFSGFSDSFVVYFLSPTNSLVQVSVLDIGLYTDQYSDVSDTVTSLKPPPKELPSPIKEIVESIKFDK